jgi:transposase InsO family protein
LPFATLKLLIQSSQETNTKPKGAKKVTQPLKTAVEAATERFNLIAPLVSDGLDKGRRYDLMREIAERSGISARTLRRYVNAWKGGGFEALKPKQGWERPDSKLGDSFEQIVRAAIELRRESPSRSVADIIKILELEGAISPGEVARSTLQRHLAAKGYASSQMRMYTSKGAAARRFQKEHRSQLWMSDIKYGPFVPGENGRKKQLYLVVWIDDATRYIVSARFYLDQTVDALEDSLHRAVQNFGVPDKVFVDNGSQYKSEWFSQACAKLGIRLLTARPYHPEAKGLVERFNRTVEKFISEAILAKPSDVSEYNELLRIWIDEYYHKNSHSALGVSPATAFGTDTRPLKFVCAEQLRDAFLHTETRKVDKTGCVSFRGSLYEVGLAYIGRKIEIRFEPSWSEEIEVLDEHSKPFIAKKLVIGTNCGTTQEVPEHMRTTPPQTSRMLNGLKKEHQSKHQPTETANTFKGLWEEGTENV